MVNRRRTAASTAPTASTAFVCALALACMQTPLFADISPSARIEAQTTLPSLSGDGIADFVGIARISLDSSKNDAVKGKVAFAITEGAASAITLEQAWLRTRFPWFTENSSLRLTAGKAPVSWGRGFLFNAADPVFGAVPAIDAFGSGEYRTATDWLAGAYVPFGDFSFAEILLIPGNSVVTTTGTTKSAAGGVRMFATPALGVLHSIEINYLAREPVQSSTTDSGSGIAGGIASGIASGSAHTLSLCADGSLYFDWYAAASVALPHNALSDLPPEADDAKPLISAGLFKLFAPPLIQSLSLRAEGLFAPESFERTGNSTIGVYGSIQAALSDLWSVAVQGNTMRTTRGGDTEETASADSKAALTASFTPIKGFTVSASVIAAESPFRRFINNGFFWTFGFTATF